MKGCTRVKFLEEVHGDASYAATGDQLMLASGHRYEVVEVSGRTIHARVMSAKEPLPSGEARIIHWNPIKQKGAVGLPFLYGTCCETDRDASAAARPSV